MVLVSELIARVRIKYDAESGGASVRYTDDQLMQFANEGIECLAEATRFYERYVTVPVEAGRTYYGLDGFIPETVVGLASIWSTELNDWLTPLAETDMPYDWTSAVGTPYRFMVFGVNKIAVYPRPDTSTGFLRIYFSGIPHKATHLQWVLGDLPDSYIPALEDYMLYEMSALDRQTKLAIQHWQSYAKREKQLRDFVDRRIVSTRAGRLGGIPESIHAK